MKLDGTVLRCKAEAWLDQSPTSEARTYENGWNEAMRYCGRNLSGYLDSHDVPQLEPESDDEQNM